ncbi:hypothetical protein MOX02_52520 [Methylobacterium oxalidis]|uniref:Uncharacterized protein n=1 Tax=Methylobacterium oxalidis TaxID=944322 RepID=A0A512JB48_9HYPH|nr:hypothetical protein MOX02_52520 [Methylobacterium oxalidis]GLS67636.1 hypothetical protein GCM10007888_60200 [Methylobacterium oxalidis]
MSRRKNEVPVDKGTAYSVRTSSEVMRGVEGVIRDYLAHQNGWTRCRREKDEVNRGLQVRDGFFLREEDLENTIIHYFNDRRGLDKLGDALEIRISFGRILPYSA